MMTNWPNVVVSQFLSLDWTFEQTFLFLQFLVRLGCCWSPYGPTSGFGLTLSSSPCWYDPQFIAVLQSLTITLPPLCLTVQKKLFSLKGFFGLHQTSLLLLIIHVSGAHYLKRPGLCMYVHFQALCKVFLKYSVFRAVAFVWLNSHACHFWAVFLSCEWMMCVRACSWIISWSFKDSWRL